MIILFEIIKIIFFIFSIGMGIFFLRGFYYLPQASFSAIGNILMPAYLILVGLMIGYIILSYYKTRSTQLLTHKEYVKSFVGGIILGVILAVFYIFAQ